MRNFEELLDLLFELFVGRLLWRLLGLPRQVFVTVVLNDVKVNTGDGGHCWLQLGNQTAPPLSVGINITVTLVNQPLRRGRIEFVQLVKPNLRRSPGPNGADQVFTSDGEWVLDTRDPYGGLTFPMGASPRPAPEPYLHDSPRICCVAHLGAGAAVGAAVRPYEMVSANDDFRAFIMWRPEALGGRVRFALGHVDWHWDGVATITNQGGDCNCAMDPQGRIGQWALTPPAGNRRYVTRTPNMRRRPRWRRSTGDLQWRDAS